MAATMTTARLLLLFLVAGGSGLQAALASVEETCAKATATAGGDPKDLDSFCVTTLQAAPGSASADARGLAFIATNLTLANYTAAVATVKALQRHGGWSEGEAAALATCRQKYIQALNVVHSAIHALATKNTQAYVADMGAVRRAATDCDDAFKSAGAGAAATLEGGGEESAPLRKVDEDAANLTTVAMLIVTSL